jgi:hypothetical protein
MSQHNIVGSEAFERAPFVYIRAVRAGGLRRRRARTAVAFMAGAVVALALGAAGIAAALSGAFGA